LSHFVVLLKFDLDVQQTHLSLFHFYPLSSPSTNELHDSIDLHITWVPFPPTSIIIVCYKKFFIVVGRFEALQFFYNLGQKSFFRDSVSVPDRLWLQKNVLAVMGLYCKAFYGRN